MITFYNNELPYSNQERKVIGVFYLKRSVELRLYQRLVNVLKLMTIEQRNYL